MQPLIQDDAAAVQHSILKLMDRLLADQFGGESWSRWRAILKATFGEPMSKADLETFEELTGRKTAPDKPVRELWCVCGRRSGKSMISALVAVFLATCRQYKLAPGEQGVFMVIAADRRQARVVHRYIGGLLHSHPVLEAMIQSETKTAFGLVGGIAIEIHTASYRTIRGYSVIGAVLDEIAFFRTDDAAEPDREVLNALRPAMATVPGAVLMCVSSPYARRGSLYDVHRTHYGKDGGVLVVQGETRQLNPTVPQSEIDRAYEADAAHARAEWGAQFRSDVEGFVPRETIEACVYHDRRELPPIRNERYFCFVDFAGGSGADSATLAIAHKEQRNDKRVLILDCVREFKPPFSPANVCNEFATTMTQYRCFKATADRFAGEFPVEGLKVYGIELRPSKLTKSDIYKEFLPLLNSNTVELLDNPKMVSQLSSLERRVARGGRDSIDHAPGAHDDVANAVAGVLTLIVVGPQPLRLVAARWG